MLRKQLWEFSPQQIASCTTTCYGCGGGATQYAYEYILGVIGLGSAAYAPYVQSMYQNCGGPSCTYACSNYNLSQLKQYGPDTGPYATLKSWSYATPACTSELLLLFFVELFNIL